MREDMKFRNAVNGFNKSDVMICIENLLKENAELKNKIKSLEEEVFVCKTSLDKVQTETQNKDVCAECDAAKMAQAQLGAAMLDAKRFSEMLLKDANDKSAQVLNNALKDTANAAVTATELSAEVKKAKERVSTSLDSLQEELTAIILSFAEFKGDLEKKGEKYVFLTDFDNANAEGKQ